MADKIKDLVRVIRAKMREQFDWIHVIVGPEGVGKSSLAWFMQKRFNPAFGPDDNIFSPDEFIKKVRKSAPFQGKNVDEGAIVFYSADASTREGRRSVKLLTGMRDYYQFCTICIPNFWILTKYIRQHRVSTVMRITKRGWVHYYCPKKVKQIKRDKRTLKTIWPEWDFRDTFPDAGLIWPVEWSVYKERKKKEVLESEENQDGPRAICLACGYGWNFAGRTAPRCGRCGSRKVVVEGNNHIDAKWAGGPTTPQAGGG